MKTIKNLLVLTMAALAFAGCQKEHLTGGQLQLVTESMKSSYKLAVDGFTSNWATGDRVWINNESADVVIAGSTASITSESQFEAPFYGVYPASIYGSGYGSTNYTLNLPASYTYAKAGGHQNLQSPMVAYAARGNKLLFKHVTAAVAVEVTNDFGIDVKLTNITISSNSYKLSGSTAVTFDTEHDTVIVNPVAKGASPDADTAVQMTFGSGLDIASGASVTVQVPVRPVGAGNKFTISVTVVNKDDAEMVYTFSKTQASANTMTRAQLGFAPAKFGGVFTVASGKQVRFSPGNLQYQASTGTWRFAKQQYDYIGAAAGNNVTEANGRYTQAAWIDLFCWATSGYDNTANDANAVNFAPYLPTISTMVDATYNYYGYGPSTNMTDKNLVGTSAHYDWGVHNAISNGGQAAGIWRTLGAGNGEGEWFYLLGTSSSPTPGTNCRSISNTLFEQGRYTMATIGDTYKGMIVFPDDYVHPEGTDFVAGTFNTKTDYTATVSIAGWKKMEVAGAVFLPAAGYRTYNVTVSNPNSYGRYWSVTYKDKSNAYYMQFNSISVQQNYANRSYGASVRLVRNVE